MQTSEQMPLGGNIAKAVAKVMAEVGSVQKGGTNSFHNYKYAKAEDVLHALQRTMAGAGLVIFQNEKSVELLFGDAVMKATYEFVLAHESGEERHPLLRSGMAAAKNTKGGFDDKALNKCSTAALKYFLISLFKIPTGDYDDADKDEDKPAARNGSISARAKATGPVLVPNATPDGDFGPPKDGEEYDDSASRNAYIAMCKEIIMHTDKSEADVREWWTGESRARRDFGLSQLEVNLLKSAIAERFKKEKSA
jgi:hypothetical protein